MTSWPFYYAWKQLFPSGKKVSFFAVVAMLGVALGVMVLIIVQSVMNGFGSEIRAKMIATHGDVQVRAPQILQDPDSIEARLLKENNVQSVTPFAEGVVMIQHRGHPAFPFIHGIEKTKESDFYKRFMVAGRFEAMGEDTVLLSVQLARMLGATTGSVIELFTPLMLERLKEDEVLLPLELRVGGVFETGWNEIDQNTILCTLPLMQELYGLGHGVHGFCVRLRPGVSVEAFAESINGNLPAGVKAYTWMDLNKDLLFMLNVEKTTLFFIILFIVVVACFSIASSLMVSVYRKTREIGLLIAMGASQGAIACSFCIQGAILGLGGSLLGSMGAFIALAFRSEIMRAFYTLTHGESAFLRYYLFSKIPVEYRLSDFCIILGCALLLTILAGCVPALRAARLRPSEALRYE